MSWILKCSEESYLLNSMVFSPTWAASCNQHPPSHCYLNFWFKPQSLNVPQNAQGPKAAEKQKAEASCTQHQFHLDCYCHFLQFIRFLPCWEHPQPAPAQCPPVELPDGPQSADVPTAAGQDGQVVGVQGEEETFRWEFRLRKQRRIPVWKTQTVQEKKFKN